MAHLGLPGSGPGGEGDEIADELFGHVRGQFRSDGQGLATSGGTDAEDVRVVDQKITHQSRAPHAVHRWYFDICANYRFLWL